MTNYGSDARQQSNLCNLCNLNPWHMTSYLQLESSSKLLSKATPLKGKKKNSNLNSPFNPAAHYYCKYLSVCPALVNTEIRSLSLLYLKGWRCRDGRNDGSSRGSGGMFVLEGEGIDQMLHLVNLPILYQFSSSGCSRKHSRVLRTKSWQSHYTHTHT